VKSNKPNISLIRKYLNGELDASAMYQLERQAQDDPMLMDVMMGMEADGQNQDQHALADISQRIKNRVGAKRSVKLFPWKTWTVAASLVLVLSFITFIVLRKPEEVQFAKQRTKEIDKKIKEISPDTPTPVKAPEQVTDHARVSKSPLLAKRRKQTVIIRPQNAEPGSKAAALARTDSIIYQGGALSEVVVVGYGIQSRRDVTASVATIRPTPGTFDKELEGKVAGISMAKLKKTQSSQKLEEKYANNNIMIRGMSSLPLSQQPLYVVNGVPYSGDINTLKPDLISSVEILKDASATAIYGARAANGVVVIKTKDENLAKSVPFVINGVIRDGESKLPIPGASVLLKESGRGTNTDVNGKFSLTASSKSEKLEVSMIGYDKKQLKIKGNDTLSITLLPSDQSLDEVVITRTAPVKPVKPEPIIGWKAYDQYLEDGATLNDDNEGRVTLAFTIAADGTPSNLTVVKSDNDAISKKAIELITTGPKWNPGKGMAGREIKLKIKFH